ncbi:gustatory receptor for sugar taste 43a-like [Vespula squamosa]|uniref:Gustatory receptor n=1 Tax=Vespula squamosa TaxID=30214 RepID=A0ABD2AZU8_VESSQ
MVKVGSKEFQRSILPLIIANSIVCTGLLEYFNILNIFVEDEITKMTVIITKFEFFVNFFLYVISICAGLIREKRMKMFVEQLENCTREMDKLHISKNSSSFFRYQCIAGIFLIVIISGLILFDTLWYIDTNFSLDIWMLHYCYFDNYPTIARQLFYLLRKEIKMCIKIKFGQLNTVLQSMLTTTIDSPQHKRVLRMKDNWEDDSSLSTIYRTYKVNKNLKKLKRVRQIHSELIKCARIINETYGLHIFISTSSSVVFLITLLHNLYILLLEYELKNCIEKFYAMFYWITFYVIEIFAINNICETTMTENIGDILYELYEPSTSHKFRNEIRNFTYQLAQNRLIFTACGFYHLDHTFIYNAIGLITTYLVILIQVEDKPNNTLEMSLSAEFRRSIKPLVIINSIFTTGLVEYSIDNKINTIGMVYACFLIILYITMGNLFLFPMEDYSMKPSLITQITHQLHAYSGYVFFIITIIAGILRRKKIKLLTLQIETCIRTMDQLNIPMDFSKFFWQQCYIILCSICILIALIGIDCRWLKLPNMRKLIFFYLKRYPFVIWLVADVSFIFWIWQVYRLICCKTKLNKY